MTSLYLLLWIVGGVLLQLAIYLGLNFWHHWQNFQTLRSTVIEGGLTVSPAVSSAESTSDASAWQGLRIFMVTQKVVEDANQNICSFHLAPQDGLPLPAFLPGQFLTFRLDIPAHDGNTLPVTRCYSLSDAPSPDSYRVSIKRAPALTGELAKHPSSSNYFHDHVRVGSLLQMRAPAGHFYIDASDAPVVLVGGGIGITPMMSMLNWALTKQPGREIWLFYGVRNRLELIAQAHLQALAALHPNFHLNICFSQPGTDDVQGHSYQHHGHVDVTLLRRLLPLKPYHFYICGPSVMLQSLVPALEDWGVPDAHIHFEAFGPASVKRKSAVLSAAVAPSVETSAAVMVTFAKAGKQLPWKAGAGTLLDLAESHGIVVDSGCRAGGCGTCQTTISAGEVSYQQTPEFDPEPGTCLMCVCTPKTNVTLEL